MRGSNVELRDKGFRAVRSLLSDAHQVESIEIGSLAGEAEKLSKYGASFISYVAGNAWFHSPEDRWPHAVNVDDTAAIAEAVANLVSRAAVPA